MPRLCFTINPNRKYSEIISYKKLFENHLFSGVELFYPYMHDEEFIKDYEKGVKEIINNDTEVVLHLPHGIDNDLTNYLEQSKLIKRFKDAIDFGKKFNATKYTLHLGNVKYGNRDLLIYNVVKVVDMLASYAYPSIIMIENMPSSAELGYSIEELKYIFSKIEAKNVGFIFDFGHANVAKKESLNEISEYLKEFKDILYHLHISDNDGKKDAHARIGSGNIDYLYLFSLLKDYQGLYCLEIIYNDVNDLLEYYDDIMKLFNK